MQPHGLQHASFLCPPLAPEVCSNSCPLSQWCYITISSSATHFFCLQSFPLSQLLASGDQSIGTSASESVLPVNIQGWFLLGLTGFILLSKGLLRVFSSTTIQKHWFFLWRSAFFLVQLSRLYMTTGKIVALTMWTFVSKVMSLPFTTLPRSFPSKKQVSFNFMAAVIICSDFGAQENKVCHCFYFSPFYL